jgi:DNA-binding GntR family transcriptional regulator
MTASGPTGRAPKYQRAADQLRREISAGTWRPGDRLPPEPTLAERFRISLPTIRQAIGVLRGEGLLESRHGVGTFVKEERRLHRRSRRRYGRARADQQLLTSHLEHRIVSAGPEPLPQRIAEAMGEEPGTQVIVRRRHLYDQETGRPEELGASYIPAATAAGTYLEEPEVVPKALFLCIEELSGKRFAHAYDQWTARMPTADEADALDLPTGAPVVHVIHVARADDDTVLEVSESVWPADRIVVVDDYPIDAEPDDTSVPSEI